MNERYLFRGRCIYDDKGHRVANGEWIIGFYFNRVTQHYIKVPSKRGGVDVLTDYEIDPATLGQCTDLRDKNGKLAFEGDIVRAKHGTGYIKWHDKGLTGWLVEYTDRRELVYSDNRQEYEVIGNIHDNPELLEAQ